MRTLVSGLTVNNQDALIFFWLYLRPYRTAMNLYLWIVLPDCEYQYGIVPSNINWIVGKAGNTGQAVVVVVVLIL